MCTASITRVLDVPNCFDQVGQTIPISNILSHLGKKNNCLPKGALKKLAVEKFRVNVDREPPKKETKYKDISRNMKNNDKKKKKDPLDVDKYFLLGLVKTFEETDVKLPKKKNLKKGPSASGHAKEILGYLNSRDKFWAQI